ncbi:hypothetical protein FISHEDRAFT_32277 [Fistulina hepatica ATCC 64428]|uniref:Ribosomal protein S6 n=1 Tax=Fistulina hepatica ATCC 64428 TaxID=1128425 RepID=A0A0D7AQD1_9AGAR|nr:hypothetical protein FISHEDRAFT_32277 [Fistulina hepatica ATCC 64428]
MPMYEMLCIASHNPQYVIIKELVKQSALHVMNRGGIVRNIDFWGSRTLPQRMRDRGNRGKGGASYWTLHFDASPRTLRSLNSLMQKDPRVLRWSLTKVADNVQDLAKHGELALKAGNLTALQLAP